MPETDDQPRPLFQRIMDAALADEHMRRTGFVPRDMVALAIRMTTEELTGPGDLDRLTCNDRVDGLYDDEVDEVVHTGVMHLEMLDGDHAYLQLHRDRQARFEFSQLEIRAVIDAEGRPRLAVTCDEDGLGLSDTPSARRSNDV